MDIVTIFILVSSLLLEILITVFYFLTKHKFKGQGAILFYTAYTFISVVILNLLINRYSGTEYLSFRVFTIVECLTLILYLRLILSSKTAKTALIFISIGFVAFSIWGLITNRNEDTFDSIPTVIECLIIIGFSMFYFYEQLKNPQSLFLYSTPNFWIVVGLIIFFAGNFFVFIYAQSNSESIEFKNTFGLINAILSFIENILFLIAFIIARQQSKTIKSNTVAKTT